MREPSNGSPVVKSRGPIRAPDSNASRFSRVSYALVAGIADRRDAPGEKRASERFAEVLAQVRVDLDQPGNDRLARRIDDRAGVQRVADAARRS